jgi:membrane-bound serine protease (ClpP class)
MIALLSSLTPDAAILLLTLGLALIAVELNRPGAILPGALGLLVTLLAAAKLAHLHPNPAAFALLLAASAVLLLQLRRRLPLWAAALAALAVITGLLWLVPAAGQPPIHPAIAILCGLALGVGTTVLTRLARRARQNKGLD